MDKIMRDSQINPSAANPDVKHAGIQYMGDLAAHGEHIKNTGAICNSSASHTYGNVMAVVEQYVLKEIFPPGVFKTVTASTTLASRQVTHLPMQLSKKEMPMMVLVPRIMYGQDDNRFLAHTLINSRMNNTFNTWGDGSLIPLAKDPRKRLYVHGHYNRAVMYIDFIMNFNTYNEQINYMSMINNMVPIGHNQFIKAPLELYIPNSFCELIGDLSHIPVKGKDKSVYDFLRYMNTIWDYPITYKLKGSSNSDEFFMYYLADIDTVFQEPQAGPGIKDGQLRRSFEVSFTVRCEFNTIGYFTLNSPDFKKSVRVPTTSDEGAIITMFSDSINLRDFDLPVGWVILSWPVFKLGIGKNSISIDTLLNESLRSVIDYHLKLGIPMERFIRFQFREDGEILDNEMF